MSSWTYIKGLVEVMPFGRTQAEKRYILDTVLDHLPLVTGSENDMNVYIIKRKGHDMSSSHNEFSQMANNGTGIYCGFKTQSTYYLLVEGSLRDRKFDETYKEFQNWLCRLAKRLEVSDVLVEVKDWKKSILIRNQDNCYTKMLEEPSWYRSSDSVNWCEYLMWEEFEDGQPPIGLVRKYDPEIYKEYYE